MLTWTLDKSELSQLLAHSADHSLSSRASAPFSLAQMSFQMEAHRQTQALCVALKALRAPTAFSSVSLSVVFQSAFATDIRVVRLRSAQSTSPQIGRILLAELEASRKDPNTAQRPLTMTAHVSILRIDGVDEKVIYDKAQLEQREERTVSFPLRFAWRIDAALKARMFGSARGKGFVSSVFCDAFCFRLFADDGAGRVHLELQWLGTPRALHRRAVAWTVEFVEIGLAFDGRHVLSFADSVIDCKTTTLIPSSKNFAQYSRLSRGFTVRAAIAVDDDDSPQTQSEQNEESEDRMSLLTQCVMRLDSRLSALSETVLQLQRRHASDLAALCQQLQRHSQFGQRMATHIRTVEQRILIRAHSEPTQKENGPLNEREQKTEQKYTETVRRAMSFSSSCSCSDCVIRS